MSKVIKDIPLIGGAIKSSVGKRRKDHGETCLTTLAQEQSRKLLINALRCTWVICFTNVFVLK